MGIEENDRDENNILHSLLIDQETSNFFRFYGVLQYALMSLRPSVIALGLVKN